MQAQLEPLECAVCTTQYEDAAACFGQNGGATSSAEDSYASFWREHFPRASGEESTSLEFDMSVEYANSILRAVLPWVIAGALMQRGATRWAKLVEGRGLLQL